MPAPLEPDVRAAILDDIRAGGTCRGIARTHGVAASTVAKIARAEGLTDAFERAQTKSATQAKMADNKQARAVEAAETIAVAALIRGRILEARSGRDAQGWAVAYGIMADKHVQFEKHDNDVQGIAAVDAWIDAMLGRS